MIGMIPAALGMVGGAGGKALLANGAVRAGMALHDAHGALKTIEGAANTVAPAATKKVKQRLNQVSPEHVAAIHAMSPMTRLAADLRAMAAAAPPAALTTEGATARTDRQAALPSGGATEAAAPAKTALAADAVVADDDRGAHSTQLGAGRATDLAAVPRAPKLKSAIAPDKVAFAFLRPAWRVVRHGANVVGDYINKAAPYAGHVVTYGGAAITAKGLYDMIRAEKERNEQMQQAASDRMTQAQRESEFHDARMRMLDAATSQYEHRVAPTDTLPPLSLPVHDPNSSMGMDPGTGGVYSYAPSTRLLDQSIVQPTDVTKRGSFDPRVPAPAAKPKPFVLTPTPHRPSVGESLTQQLDRLVGPPLASAIGPYGINFDPHSTPTLRV